MIRNFLYAFFVLFIMSCGSKNSGGGQGPLGGGRDQDPGSCKAGGPVAGKANLMLFAAPWCEPCESELPQVDAHLLSDLGAKKDQVAVTLYVVTGVKPSQKPDQATACSYRDRLHLHFNATADFWKTGQYQTYYSSTQLQIPGAVIILANGQKKIFAPGSFVPEELIAYLKNNIP
jgi:thiol-disulfide isomerase/thioredoxin